MIVSLALHTPKYIPPLFQVLVTNLDVETVTHYEPANFWIGPSAVSIHTTYLHITYFVYIYLLALLLTGAQFRPSIQYSELKGRQCVYWPSQ